MLVRRQQGQSLVLASLLLMVAAVVLLLVFNSAQLTRSKMELQNTADATAYSIATIAARDYNFTAYMNRAMVANQVAVAQMVGLSSWFRFTGTTLENIGYLCDPIPGLGEFCLTVNETYKGFDTVFQNEVVPNALNIIGHWLGVLSNLEMAFHLGNVEAIAQNLLYGGGAGLQAGVLKLNDADASLLKWPDKSSDIPADLYQLAILIKDAADWWKFTSRYDGSKDLPQSRFADVTRKSEDGFAESRSWDTPKARIVDTDRVLKILPKWLRDIIEDLEIVHISGFMDVGLSRRGGTELKEVNDKYSWSAADTLIADGTATVEASIRYPCGITCKHWYDPTSCHIKYCTEGKSWSVDVGFPVGWGAAYSPSPDDETPGEEILNAGLDDSEYGGAAGGDGLVGVARKLAFDAVFVDDDGEPLKSSGSFGGLQPYYDVGKSGDVSTRNNDGPQFTIVVGKDLDKVRTASRAGFGAPADGVGPLGLSSLRLDEPSGVDTFYAISKGRLRFSRDGQFSNLFGPYWEAKLADTTDQERFLAYEALFGWKDILKNPLGAAEDLSGLSPYAH